MISIARGEKEKPVGYENAREKLTTRSPARRARSRRRKSALRVTNPPRCVVLRRVAIALRCVALHRIASCSSGPNTRECCCCYCYFAIVCPARKQRLCEITGCAGYTRHGRAPRVLTPLKGSATRRASKAALVRSLARDLDPMAGLGNFSLFRGRVSIIAGSARLRSSANFHPLSPWPFPGCASENLFLFLSFSFCLYACLLVCRIFKSTQASALLRRAKHSTD